MAAEDMTVRRTASRTDMDRAAARTVRTYEPDARASLRDLERIYRLFGWTAAREAWEGAVRAAGRNPNAAPKPDLPWWR